MYARVFCGVLRTDKAGCAVVYYLNAYGGVKKMKDVRLIVKDIDWMPWAGGEFIGGTASFF